MAFIVTGAGPAGVTSFTCDTAVSALEKARDLINRGFRDVLITDEDGRLYAPAEFYRFFIETGAWREGHPAPETAPDLQTCLQVLPDQTF